MDRPGCIGSLSFGGQLPGRPHQARKRIRRGDDDRSPTGGPAFSSLCAAALVATVTLAAVFGTLWRRSIFETHRAEAQELLALGALDLEANPTAALAWARASIHASDTYEGRLFAVEALDKAQQVGTKHEGPIRGGPQPRIQPGRGVGRFRGLGKIEGRPSIGRPPYTGGRLPNGRVDGDLAVLRHFRWPVRRITKWRDSNLYNPQSLRDFQISLTPRRGGPRCRTRPGDIVISRAGNDDTIELWRFDSPRELLAIIPPTLAGDADAAGEWFFFVPAEEERKVYRQSLMDPALPPDLVHSHSEPVSDLLLHPELEWIVVRGRESNRITVWPLQDQPQNRSVLLTGAISHASPSIPRDNGLSPRGNWTIPRPRSSSISAGWPAPNRSKFDRLPRERVSGVTFDPSGRWLVVGNIGFRLLLAAARNPKNCLPRRWQAVGPGIHA